MKFTFAAHFYSMKLNFRHLFYLTLIISGAGIFASFSTKKSPESGNMELINRIFDAVANVKTLKYSLQCNERIKGRMQHTESKVKMQINPRKLYLNIRGVEVLWVQGKNN